MDDYGGVATCFFLWGGGGGTTLPGMVSRSFLGCECCFGSNPPAGNSNLAGVWSIFGLWHLEKFRAQPENTKTQYGARGTFMEKNVTTLFRKVFCTFLGKYFFLVGPPPAGNSDVVGFGPFWPFGTWRKFGPGRKNTRTKFPGARGTFMEKNVTTLSRMVFRRFLRRELFLGRTPTGRKFRGLAI